jgi:cytochrome c-type biogenesis protein
MPEESSLTKSNSNEMAGTARSAETARVLIRPAKRATRRRRIAGAVIIFFGAILLGWIRIPALYGEKRFQGTIKQGRLRSFLLGLAFAFGWTPCVGPALVAMLMLASTQETVTRGTALLSVYSAGLAVPFLLVALGTSQFVSFYQRCLVWVERSAGALLICVGVLVFFDLLQELSYRLSFFNRFAW